MSPLPQVTIDSLTAPSEDGGALIWPQPKKLLRMAEENRRQRESYEFMLMDRPAKDWLQDNRRSADTSQRLVIMTGHQPAFFHPGVWAKTIVATALAEKAGGQCLFLVVDGDVPHHIAIQWPDDSGALGPPAEPGALGCDSNCRLRRKEVATMMYNLSYEHITDGAEIVCEKMFAAIPDAFRRDPHTALSAFENGFLHPDRDGQEGNGGGYVDRWIGGMKSIERELGMTAPTFSRISEIFSGSDGGASDGVISNNHFDPSFAPVENRCHSRVPRASAAGFVAHLLTEAEAFASVYNQALAIYRKRRGIRGHQHPIPDLIISEDRIELPFWLVSTSEPRQRLMVSRVGSGDLHIFAGTHRACILLRDDLVRDPIKALTDGLIDRQIRPRALALTMYARIFACDLFIHGIGGAKYDQITDEVIRRFFKVQPPAYPCVSATLRLPIPRYDATEHELRTIRHQVRDLRYNPQRYLSAVRTTSPLKTWVTERQEALHESTRLRKERPRDRAARHAVFQRIRRVNANLLQAASDVQTETKKRIDVLTDQIAHNMVADSREWFFALYPRERLLVLRDTLRGSIR